MAPISWGRRSRTWATRIPVAIAFTALLVLPSFSTDTPASGGEGSSADLPFTLRDATAVYDGQSAYVFGGYSLRNGTEGLIADSILRFDPKTDQVTELAARLPFPLLLPDSFWDGTRAYIYGGTDYNGTPLDHLIIFTPPDNVELRAGFFPYGLKGTSTVWTGQYAYIFGNCVCTAQAGQQNILRFDPGKMELFAQNGSLPFDLAGTSAVWTGKEAFIFGGNTAQGATDAILRFDPETGQCAPVQSRLPFPRYKTGAAYVDGKAYIFGGRHFDGFTDEVLVYDPAEDDITVSEKRLSHPSACKAYCTVKGTLLLFGGEKANEPLDRVESITLKAGVSEPVGPDEGIVTEQAVASALLALVAIMVLLVLARRRKGC